MFYNPAEKTGNHMIDGYREVDNSCKNHQCMEPMNWCNARKKECPTPDCGYDGELDKCNEHSLLKLCDYCGEEMED
jgi:hypothetical protein